MNYFKACTILTILSILIVENNAGLVDTVFGTFKNTTSEVTHGVGNLLSFGRDLVTGKHHPTGHEVVEEKKGIVRGFIDSVHKDIHDVHDHIRNIFLSDAKNNTKGIIGNMFDRMKNKVSKVNEFVRADGEKRKEMITNSRDKTLMAYQHLHAHLFGNGTVNHGSKLREAIKNLKTKIKSFVHRDTTDNPKPDTTNDNTDGTGLIDIRMASDNLARNLDEDMTRTKSRFNQGIDELNKNVDRNRNYIENNEKEFTETSRKKIKEGALVFKD